MGLMYLLPVLIWKYTHLCDWMTQLLYPTFKHYRLTYILAKTVIQGSVLLLSLLISFKLFKRHLYVAIGLLIAAIPVTVVVYRLYIYPLTLSGRLSPVPSDISENKHNESVAENNSGQSTGE